MKKALLANVTCFEARIEINKLKKGFFANTFAWLSAPIFEVDVEIDFERRDGGEHHEFLGGVFLEFDYLILLLNRDHEAKMRWVLQGLRPFGKGRGPKIAVSMPSHFDFEIELFLVFESTDIGWRRNNRSVLESRIL